MPKPPGLNRVLAVLGGADAIAHLAFFWIFLWRIISGGGEQAGGRVFAVIWTVLAALGLLAAIVGRLLVKHGGRGPAHRVGVWAIAASTALAGVLLVIAA